MYYLFQFRKFNWMDFGKSRFYRGCLRKLNFLRTKLSSGSCWKGCTPNYISKGVEFEKLDKIRVEEIEKPFIIKPAVGLFSLGVHKVSTDAEWDSVLKRIKAEVKEMFTETRGSNWQEIKKILKSDLREYITFED